MPVRQGTSSHVDARRHLRTPNEAAAKLNPDLPVARPPATPQLIARAQIAPPSQTQNPAEGPSLQPSLALKLDPASASSLSPAQLSTSFPQGPTLATHPAPVRPSVTPITLSPYLHQPQSQSPPTCTSSSQTGLSVSHPARVSSPLYLFQSSQLPRLNQAQA